jgi:putative membrane protein
MCWGYMGWGGGFMMFFLTLLIIVAIFWFLRSANHNGKEPSVKESPLDILKRRYARGEITKAEYDNMKRDLT